jgi:hypothetical protein
VLREAQRQPEEKKNFDIMASLHNFFFTKGDPRKGYIPLELFLFL